MTAAARGRGAPHRGGSGLDLEKLDGCMIDLKGRVRDAEALREQRGERSPCPMAVAVGLDQHVS